MKQESRDFSRGRFKSVPIGMALLLVQYVLVQIAPPEGKEG